MKKSGKTSQSSEKKIWQTCKKSDKKSQTSHKKGQTSVQMTQTCQEK